MPQAYADWYAALQNAYGRWGPPAHQTLYTVFETGTLPTGVMWVKLGQFRHGDFYRDTRFYRWENDRWIWTLPDASFWSGAAATLTTGDAGTIGPISINYPIEDAPVLSAVFDRFTRVYQNLCESLKCSPPHDRSRLWTPGLTLSISIQPLLTQPAVRDRGSTFMTVLSRYHKTLQAQGCRLMLAEVSDGVLEQLERTGRLEKLGEANIFPETPRVHYATRQAIRAGNDWLSAPA